MPLFADTHVHLYSCYDPQVVFHAALENARHLVRAECALALCLVERSGQDRFRSLREAPERGCAAEYEIRVSPEPEALVVRDARGAVLHLVAGRQIASRERLEILALATEAQLPDGRSARETVEVVLAAGGIPVLPWSPGKWFSDRGKAVEEVLRSFSPGQLLMGDTALRPVGWREPRLIRLARERGFRVVAGSDPLPFAGEERFVGTYGIRCEATFDEARPVTEARRILSDPRITVERVGRRNGSLTAMRRWLTNAGGKKRI
jgi:hypothetical protein